MNSILIPKKFTLLGHSYKVKLYKEVDKGKSYGEHDYDKKLIRLQKPGKDHSQDSLEETYLHEMIHAILDHMGHDELSHDEKFVSTFSGALHQILKTSVYADTTEEHS